MRTYDTSEYFTFGGAKYILLIPAINQRAPRARARSRRQWTEIPYGGNKNENGIGRGPTIWTPQGGIAIPDSAAYSTFESLDDQFATLTTPWGTFRAVLTSFVQIVPYDDGSYRGPVTFEWTT